MLLLSVLVVGWPWTAEHPPSHSWKENWKESWKTVGKDKNTLIGEAKLYLEQCKIHSLLPTRRKMVSHFQESQPSAQMMVTCEEKSHNRECLFLLISLSFLLLSVTLYGLEYPSGQLGSDVPAMSLPSPLPTSASSLGRQHETLRKPKWLSGTVQQ